jgi:hypothetical protein
MIKFKDFHECRESGRILFNPFWLEHLLNLFFQGYFGEVWCELMDTKINTDKTIEDTGYGVIAAVEYGQKQEGLK